MSAPVPPPAPRRFSWARVAIVGALAAAVVAGGYLIWAGRVQNIPPVDTARQLKGYLAQQAKHAKFADGYADADGDLVADPPADPGKVADPPKLVFSAVFADDPADAAKRWDPLMKLIAAKTGKPVEYFPDDPPPAPAPDDGDPPAPPAGTGRTTEQQRDALAAGKLHVTAFSTGQVPAAVTQAGFVPLFCPADAAGGYTIQMEVIVPAASPAAGPADLKGKTVALVALSSNSGGKAPLVLFKDRFGMLPGRDYEYTVTGDHRRSVAGVCDGRYDAACVASDILREMADKGEAKPDRFKSVFKSATFPPLCFGVPTNLAPKVREAVEAAFAEFRFAGGGPRARFARVSYKDDWKDVREVDDKLSKLLD